MAQQADTVDISNIPELRKLAEEVQRTRQPRMLRADSGDVAVLMPVRTRSLRAARRKGLTRDDTLWNIVGSIPDHGGPTDVSENVDKYLADAYADTHE